MKKIFYSIFIVALLISCGESDSNEVGLDIITSSEKIYTFDDLKEMGFYEGKLDSIWGPKSQASYETYLKNPPKTKQELSVEKLKSGGAFGKQGKRIFDYIKSLRD